MQKRLCSSELFVKVFIMWRGVEYQPPATDCSDRDSDWSTSEDESQSGEESAGSGDEKQIDDSTKSNQFVTGRGGTTSVDLAAFQKMVLGDWLSRPVDVLVLPNEPKSLKELGFEVIDPCAAGALRNLQNPRRHEMPENGNRTPFESKSHKSDPPTNPPKVQTARKLAEPTSPTTAQVAPQKQPPTPKAGAPSKTDDSAAASKQDSNGDREKVVSNLRALLISSPCAISCAELNGDYKAMIGGDIPFKTLGFLTLESFLTSLNDVLSVEMVNKKMFVKAKLAEDSQHLSSMVGKQKKTSKKVKKRIKAAAGVQAKNSAGLPAKKTRSRAPAKNNSSWLYDNSGRGNWVVPPRPTTSHEPENPWKRESLVEKALVDREKPIETKEIANKCGNPACASVDECARANREFLNSLPSVGKKFAQDLQVLPVKQLHYAASLISDILDAAGRNSLSPSTTISGLMDRQPGGKIVFKPGPRASANSHLTWHKQRCCCGCPGN
ncbi:Tudor domain [Nesidiocoris tenuis]|uniref:Tudor domain n=1 Tax=Nesidiocoris tenuis TaxID=355587 RepID=A0ABN7BDC5_9HEMI|nr:Tudor domain [Nesidiocoris tenuis]